MTNLSGNTGISKGLLAGALIATLICSVVASYGVSMIAGPQGEEGPAGPNQIAAMGTYRSGIGLTEAYNVESVVWNSDWDQYWVTFSAGIEYHSWYYVTVVTCFGGASAGFAGFGSQGSMLSIEIYDSNGNQIQSDTGDFSFVVLDVVTLM